MAEPRLDRYKILHAATNLEEFTVRDLAGSTGVDTGYIHKLISDRDGDLFEEIGTVPVPDEKRGRGRPPMQYRIADGKLEAVAAELGELAALFRPAGSAAEPSAELLAAEAILLNQLPKAETPGERDALFKAAALNLKRDVLSGGDRWAVARVLLQLAELGFTAAGAKPPSFVPVAKLLLDLGQLIQRIDADYAGTIKQWIADNPLGRSWLGPRRRVDLVRGGQLDTVRSIADRVLGVLRADDDPAAALGGLAVTFWDHLVGPPDPALSGVDVALVACDSGKPQDRATWGPVFSAAAQWGRVAGSLFVLDAHADADFATEVRKCNAQYVPFAGQLDKDALLLEVPALAQIISESRAPAVPTVT